MEKNISGQICKKDLMGKASFPSLSLLSRSFFIKSKRNKVAICCVVQVLFPFVSSELESATNDHDILKIKASLFSICTSLVVKIKYISINLFKFSTFNSFMLKIYFPISVYYGCRLEAWSQLVIHA